MLNIHLKYLTFVKINLIVIFGLNEKLGAMNSEIQSRLTKQIQKKEKISLTNGFQQYLAFSVFILNIISATLVLLLSTYLLDFTTETYFIFIVSVLICSFLIYKFAMLIADVAVKNDVLFVCQLFSTCKIIPLENVLKVKSFHFISINLTVLTVVYKGENKKVILMNHLTKRQEKPASIIQFVSAAVL